MGFFVFKAKVKVPHKYKSEEKAETKDLIKKKKKMNLLAEQKRKSTPTNQLSIQIENFGNALKNKNY